MSGNQPVPVTRAKAFPTAGTRNRTFLHGTPIFFRSPSNVLVLSPRVGLRVESLCSAMWDWEEITVAKPSRSRNSDLGH